MFVVRTLADRLWDPWLLGAFFLVGSLYTLASGFFPVRKLSFWLSCTLGSMLSRRSCAKRGLSGVQALATALASTMGTGCIAGVATALTLGGPGAVFWMWVSALLGMMTGCAEKMLSVAWQCPSPEGGMQGGPMQYLSYGLRAPAAARMFATACLCATFVGGNLVQAGTIADAMQAAFALPPQCTGALLVLLAGAAMSGGVGRIARICSALVPVMALLYLGGGFWVLIRLREEILPVLSLIFRCALSPCAVLGGGAGWSVAQAVRYGVARGVFTNEAGLGTSAIAHGAACVTHPGEQGMWGIFEVAFSTLITCTVTALVILCSGSFPSTITGAPLAQAAFGSVLGPRGEQLVGLCLLLFAFSSILGWSYYGQQCVRFLCPGGRSLNTYRAGFLLFVFWGPFLEQESVWALVDLCNACMAIPNLAALLMLMPQALYLLRQWQKTAPV